jgi:integrase
VTIAKGLRYIPPTLRAPGEGPYRLTGTKTGETREVPLPAFVAEALRERLAERDIEQRAAKVWAANDFVFCSPVGNSVPLQTLYAWFKGALKRAGLPDMRWHELRASTITLLLDMGVDLLTIQRIVGHRDLSTTRRYVGKTPAAMTGAADRLEEAMG